ncbi:LuxR C-terminal-related transcriptional regulator [Streptomyces sp. CA-249302]|uniref:LuxR C-terminal-related transcriptional regulator n=1 Tax=Streptomyces sp. CA-249302 TaxID=3240058 RepID=UPI003D89BABC
MAASVERVSGPAPVGADPLGDPFLRTRFVAPRRPATFLRRKRLVRHLDRALLTPLTVVNGSAGAGKTMLVADWAEGLALPVVWLTADMAEQGPGMFWAYLLEALRVRGVPLPGEVGRPVVAGQVDDALLARLAAGLSARDRPVLVVLDEYDRVTAAQTAEQLEFVLHHSGEGMHLVLVTRSEPPLPLHRHRAAGDLTEIRNAELAFTVEEAAALLELHGLRLPQQAVSALVDRTGGWAAGLRLCALAAQESPDPEIYLKEFEAGRSAVADFLLAEVLKRQTPETQDLLLRVSVLERFRPDLVDALTGRTDAEPILARLHEENAFVEDLGHTWYRLHPLFGEILRTHLHVRCPGLEPELHRRAARCLRRSGSLPESLSHGAAAGDWEFTARTLVDDLAIGQLFTGPGSAELTELFSHMEAESSSPATDLVRAAHDLSRNDIERGQAHLHQVQERLATDADRPAAARLSCVLLEALAARLSGSPEEAERAAEAAERLQQEVPAHLLDRHPELPALLLTHLGSARLWAGRFEHARTALSTVVGCTRAASTALAREESLGHLALIDYLNGWPGRAEHKALAALTETERFGLPAGSGSGIERLVLAAVAVDRNELAQAQSFLDEAADCAIRDPVTAVGRSLASARLLLARGDAKAALAAADPDVRAEMDSPWAEDHVALVASTAHLAEGRPEAAAEVLRRVSGDQPAGAVGAARVQLAAGNRAAAVRLLDEVRAAGRTGPAVTVRAALVRAQAAEDAGDPVAARRLVAQALVEARRERLRRPFLEATPWIRHLLAVPHLQQLAAGWLTSGPPPVPVVDRTAPLVVEELSEREHEVLERLSRMMSTQEIAADLFLSVNTVKTHLKSVYRKLAVNRRTDAVRRARELHLL